MSFFSRFFIVTFLLGWTYSYILAQTPCLPPSAFATPTPTATPEVVIKKDNIAANTSVPETISSINLVHPGDLIDVDFVGTSEYDWHGTLNEDGNLKGLDYSQEPIFGLCRTVDEISNDVSKSYSKFLREPQVVVRIIDRSERPLSVIFGAVRTPQRLNIQRQINLNEILILSGGITEQASGEVKVLRPAGQSCAPRVILKNPETQPAESQTNGEQFIKAKATSDKSETFIVKISDIAAGKNDANMLIRNGDVVTVESANPIYIMGGIANPQQIYSRQEITLSRAIASSGGLSKDADPTKVVVYRRAQGATETKIFAIDYSKIVDKSQEDFILQAFDVIEVEQTGKTKRRFPPIILSPDGQYENRSNLPLRIID